MTVNAEPPSPASRATLVRRLFLLTAVPAMVIAVALVGYLTRSHVMEIERLLQINAQTLASQTAMLAVAPVLSDDRAELARIAGAVQGIPQVSRLRIMKIDGELAAGFGIVPNAVPQDYVLASAMIYERRAEDIGVPQILGFVEIGLSRAPLAESRRAHLIGGGIALLLSLLLCSLLSGWVARLISRPIKELAHAVENLGRGQLEQRVPVTELGELGTLQRGFNITAHALQSAQQSLQDKIAAATEALAVKNCQLEAANRSKSRFFAAASHDLRQPLHALTLLSAGLHTAEQDARRHERVALIEDCVRALDCLFSELIDLSRLESGTVEPLPLCFPLDALFVEISQSFRPVAEEKSLRLVVRPTTLWVQADRTMLSRILKNLVSNAIRYTEQGGIVLGARRRGGRLRIDVWDTGVGISAEHQARIFEEFFRVEPVGRDGRQGLGLGLSTVQRLCQMMQTPIIVRSRPGRGTLFSLDVRRCEPQPALPPVVAAAPQDHDLRGRCILVIDDERTILEGVEWLLQSWGCAVAVAESLDAALDAAKQLPRDPDLIISDLRLREGRSGLDAINTLLAVYAAAGGPQPAALLITGETSAHRLREITEAGVQVLHKPVLPERLRQVMGELLAVRMPAHHPS